MLSPHSATQEADRIIFQYKHLPCNVKFLAVGTSSFSSLTYFIPHRELDTLAEWNFPQMPSTMPDP